MSLSDLFDLLPESLRLVVAERARQEEKFGGPEHDDVHSMEEWVNLIVEWLGKAAGALRGDGELDTFKDRLVQVAALALAGIESYDRRNGA
jgi:hypothetical protein